MFSVLDAVFTHVDDVLMCRGRNEIKKTYSNAMLKNTLNGSCHSKYVQAYNLNGSRSDGICAYIPLPTRSCFFWSKQKRKEKGKCKNVYLLTVTVMRMFCSCVKISTFIDNLFWYYRHYFVFIRILICVLVPFMLLQKCCFI